MWPALRCLHYGPVITDHVMHSAIVYSFTEAFAAQDDGSQTRKRMRYVFIIHIVMKGYT